MDESYSAGSARQFMLSYVDHPPCHYWAAGLAMRLFHSEASLVVRLPAILFFAGSTWLMYRLTARLFGARAGLWAATALNIAPVFTLAHASWVLPDGPLMFFMLATMNVVAAILFEEPEVKRPLLWWLAAGVLGGLAMLSKYTGVFLFVGVLVFILTVPKARRHLATPGPWLAVIAGAHRVFAGARSGTCSTATLACRSRHGVCRPEVGCIRCGSWSSSAAQAGYLFPLLVRALRDGAVAGAQAPGGASRTAG